MKNNINEVLIIAPHPDDELNLAGQIIPTLIENHIEIYVVYVTNGDSKGKDNKRLIEAIESCRILGIKEENIIFLGYANDYKSKHIYNSLNDEIVESKIGKTQTNSISIKNEYCFEKHNKHNSFSRNNIKNDLKEVICEINADLIIAPDYDEHPDHRCVSLLFEEIIGELTINYHPIILKKFAYNGVWRGPKDYYSFKQTTNNMGPFEYAGQLHELENPAYGYEDRIRIKPHASTLTPYLHNNILFKAAKKHKSTEAWYEMLRAINSDVVYWQRNTKNLLTDAIIKSSSGDVKYLTDFKFIDSDNVLVKNNSLKGKEYCWRPKNEDSVKEIDIYFNSPTSADELNIYEDFNSKNHIKRLEILIGNNKYEVEPKTTGQKTSISIKERNYSTLKIKIIDYLGVPGISEIELLQKNIIDISPLKEVNKLQESRVYEIKLKQRIEYFIFIFVFFFKHKIKYLLKGTK